MEPETGSLRYFNAGDIIVHQGEKGYCAYIVEEGEVEVLIEGPDGATECVGTRGYISPDDFIPIAEKSDLIIEASRWVLRESCHALKRIEKACPSDAANRSRPLYISMNISGADLAFDGFTDNLFATLEETGVPPGQISLEITERLLIEQPMQARNVLRACREAGMHIAIDDFGTGYSSLSYLRYFRVDTLKIDRSFVEVIAREEATFELLKSIIGLGKSMNMAVIVEGVETAEEAEMLRSVSCDMAQGFYFSRPVSEDDAAELLRAWQPLRSGSQ